MVEPGTQNPCDIQIKLCDHSLDFLCYVSVVSRSQWPRDLKRRYAAARLLKS